MNTSFSLSKSALSFWWALTWRGLVWGIVLIIPILLAGMLLGFILGCVKGLITVAFPSAAFVGIALINCAIWLLEYFAVPILIYGVIFHRLVKKGGFGNYSLKAKLHGQEPRTIVQCLEYGGRFYWEKLKYVWPMVISSFLISHYVDAAGGNAPQIAQIILVAVLMMPLSMYLHLLVLKDIMQRKSFTGWELHIQNRMEKPGTPVAVPHPVRKAPKKGTRKPAKKSN